MIRFELAVRELANTRFAISPLVEAVLSPRALSDPAQRTLHLSWLRAVRDDLAADDLDLLQSLVGPARIPSGFRGTPSIPLPDFLTPRPARFIAAFEEGLAVARAPPPRVVCRALLAT